MLFCHLKTENKTCISSSMINRAIHRLDTKKYPRASAAYELSLVQPDYQRRPPTPLTYNDLRSFSFGCSLQLFIAISF